MNLEKRLAELTHGGAPNVYWSISTPETKKVNEALKSVGAKEKLELTTELFSLYQSDDEKAIKKVFGHLPGVRPRYLGTLTGDGKQFRIWDGVPGHMSYNHVNSGGWGFLLEVVGAPQEVIKYITALLPEYVEGKFANGCKMFCRGR